MRCYEFLPKLPALPEHLKQAVIDNKEEFPAAPPEIPKLSGRPISEVLKNDPIIFQALRDEVKSVAMSKSIDEWNRRLRGTQV